MNRDDGGVEFPRALLPLLRCGANSGELICQEARGGAIGVIEGTLVCKKCAETFPIDNGVVRLLKGGVTTEHAHEMALKDAEYKAMPVDYVSPTESWRSYFSDAIEIPPHMRAVEPLGARRVLELACGDGRLTLLMARQGAEVLAVDFSIEALRKIAARLPTGAVPTAFDYRGSQSPKDLRGRIGLVQADAGAFRAAPRAFDVALSASPLDSRDERMRMFGAVADALKDSGRYVAGVEHDDLLRRIFGLPIARRYSPEGIFIEHFDAATLRREIAPYFAGLRFQPIRARLPFARRMPEKFAVFLSLAVVRVPGLRLLGEILLVHAERPIRPPVEGVRRPGIALARSAFRAFKTWTGEENVWDVGEPV